MKKLVSGVLTGTQQVFDLEPLALSREYVQAEAEAAALNRKRRIGAYALSDHTFGFRTVTANLWVPHSKTESNAVVLHPDRFIQQNADFIRRKVYEKYLGDDGIPTVEVAKVALWMQYVAKKEAGDLAEQYDGWREDARQKQRDLNPGLGSRGEILREDILENPTIVASLSAYLSDLKSYVARPETMRRNQRYWTPKNATKIMREHAEWTRGFLENELTWEFDRWFVEAWYNHRSRAKFWHHVIQANEAIHKDILVRRRMDTWRKDMERRGYDTDDRRQRTSRKQVGSEKND